SFLSRYHTRRFKCENPKKFYINLILLDALKPYETFIRIHTRPRKETYMNSQDTIKQFIDTLDQLKKKTKWQLLDHRVLMPIAATYVMRNQTFDQDRFFSIAKTIKQKAGFFSPLKSELRYTITSMLDLRFKEPQEQIPKLFHLYDEMIKAKFSRGSFTYISASILLTNTDEAINTSEVIHKAKMIY